MIENGVDAILIKVAAIGLGEKHLGKTLSEMAATMKTLQDKYGVHPCGEGGEFESFVRDCPLFKKRIVIDETEVFIRSPIDFFSIQLFQTITHQDDPVAPVFYLRLKKMHLIDK